MSQKNNKAAPLNNPLCLALDLDDDQKVYRIVNEVSDIVGGFKIGPRLLLRYGPSIIKEISKHGPVFLDMKYFDIPSTMVAAVRASFDMGARMVTVHAQAGIRALTELAKLEEEYNKTGDFKILSVTMLTSFDAETLPSVLKKQSLDQHVKELVELIKISGLTGVVCSPHELAQLQDYDDLYFLTPGIRGTTGSSTEGSVVKHHDQKRVLTAKEAINLGANALVIGRPILEAANPRQESLNYCSAIFG